MYMPSKDIVTKEFLKQILRNDKELLSLNQLRPIKVPRYQELSVKSLLPQAMDDNELKKYLPDLDQKKKPIDREYFFNILNTIYPKYVKSLIEHAQNLRNQPQLNEEKKEYILISDDWYDKFMSHPFISRKPGKTVQLLKESAKILKGRKPKKLQEIGISLKRFKGMDNNFKRIKQDQFISGNPNFEMNEVSEGYDNNEQQSTQRKNLFQI